MLPEIETLLIVQDRDQKAIALREELKAIPEQEAAAKSGLAGDIAALDEAKSKLTDCEIAIKNLELDIDTRKTSIERLEKQQFETRNNDEFSKLGGEIENYTKQISELEDEELELMEKAEGLKAEVATAKEAHDATAGTIDEKLAELAKRQANAEAQLAELATERETLIADIDENVMRMFDRNISVKHGIAVVPLEGDTCGGCHMKLTPSALSTARAGKTIATCEMCGRMVYT